MFTHASSKGPRRPAYYKLGQAPPARHWYQKRVGWFGRAFAGLLVFTLLGSTTYGYVMQRDAVRSYASNSSQSAKNTTVKQPIAQNETLENIVDVQGVVDAWVAEHPGQKWGIVAKSLSGPSFDARNNADREFQSASIYKLFLTLPLFLQIPVEQQANITVPVNGSQKSIATCVDLMLRLSNNECGESIGRYLNWKKADDALKRGGFSHTVFTQTNNLKTSAGDTASFLESLNDDMFNRNARDTIMRSLREQRFRAGIPAGCPGCITANKTGQIDNVMHDAAIVQYKGGSYVLVIFSEKGTFGQIAQLTGQIQQKILDTTR